MKHRILAHMAGAAAILLASAVHAQEKSVEMLHYFTSGGEAAAINALREKFEEAGGTWVDSPVAGGGGASHDQVLRSRTLAGDAPGAAMPKMRDAYAWQNEGYLVDLSELAAEGKWDDVYPSVVRDTAKHDGKWVAVPVDLQRGDFMWVNPEVLAKVGAEPPKTWADFIEVSDKLKAAGITPIAHGGQPWQDAYLFVAALIGVGGPDLFDKVLSKGDVETIRSDAVVKAFDELRRMRGYVDDNFSGRDWNLATGMLMRGEAAFQFNGDWVKGEVTNAELTPGKDILCLDTPRDTPGGYLWSSNTISFFAKSTDDLQPSEGQKLLARVISSAEAQTAYSLKKGNTPARLGVDKSPFDACAKFEIESVAEAQDNGTLIADFVPGMAETASYRGSMIDVITNFFNSDMSSADAANALAEAVELNR